MLYYFSNLILGYRQAGKGTRLWLLHYAGSNPAIPARKKHLPRQVLFSTKFALAGKWNISAKCEIRLRRVKYSLRECGQISFHIATKEQYFTISARELFHIRRKANISLKNSPQQVADDIHAFGVIGMRECEKLLNCFTKYDIMHVKSWFCHQEREVTEWLSMMIQL